MTFLLQKYNATSRTQVRESLRSFASGVALTSRLAVTCLLLAGFLGVGSAMAQTKVLRMGGGPVTVETDDPANAGTALQVHHYQIGTATAVMNPTGLDDAGANPTQSSFLVGGLALVEVIGGSGTDAGDLKVSPVATGKFKIALSPNGAIALTTTAGSANMGTPVEFEILSANAPRLMAIANDAKYNQAVEDDTLRISLTPRDMTTAKAINLAAIFTDPDDIVITYDAMVDKVAKADKMAYDATDDTTYPPRRDKSTAKDAVSIAAATVDPPTSMLTVSLTDKAKEHDQTDIWVFGRAGGEYARKRIQVTVQEPQNPYVVDMMDIKDVELREDALAAANPTINLHTAFADPTFADATALATLRPTGAGNAQSLTYEVAISADAKASRVPPQGGLVWTWVAASMSATVTITDTDPAEVGHDAATLLIDPRAPGSATFTVTATDMGLACPSTHEPRRLDKTATPNTWVAATVGAATDPAEACWMTGSGTDVGATPAPVTIALHKDKKSITDQFTVKVISRTTPKADQTIPGQTVGVDEKDMVAMVNLNDLNGTAANTPKAFTGENLTYAVMVADAKEDPKKAVLASVEGSVITLTPVWRAGDATVEATVTATNNLNESNTAKFNVTVKSAKKPVVNPALEDLDLPDTVMVDLGKSHTVDLRNLTGLPVTDKAKYVPLFIDPNADPNDLIPGGLQLSMPVANVMAPHVYKELSSKNDVYTSAGRVTLDPQKTTLTVLGTAPNTTTVTIDATDRERNKVSATVTFTVPEKTSAEGEELPTEVSLSQNYPNPFNPRTTIEYALPEAGDVSLIVYDMLGREVTTLLEGLQAAGRHTVNFDANHLSNGTYVYRLVSPSKTITRTMVLVK